MLDRRRFLSAGLAATGITSGLLATGAAAQEVSRAPLPPSDPLAPRVVQTQGLLPPGQIHVDPNRFSVYWTLDDGLAIRYPCGVAREGLYEPGEFFLGAKKEWPSWTPTPEMIERDPDAYARYADGMPGGPDNPLGARALYLFTPERGDTFLRIHGTNADETIGTPVSNGCARLLNEHIIDLYDRVPLGATIVLHPQVAPLV